MSGFYATLYRHHDSPDGTLGVMCADGYAAFSLELPWRDNERNVSCIPYGAYPAQWVYSPTFTRGTYLIEDVPNRDGIRIHPANRISELRGCIALGYGVYYGRDGSAITESMDNSSRPGAVSDFERHFAKRPTIIEVTWEQPFGYTGARWASRVSEYMISMLDEHLRNVGGVLCHA